ncbi:hypothetical protein MA20_12790 [Bradyrhizobium japonicum]|uniref:Uncharacterized protein n=1 Tax=Bradyrhizobium japonicum TaxID=375 RepID=A0A0A3Y148_BRAJP|nr:hypothetical protein [Bradyrhizobium japonicum]KGT79299.1 hypothetical protein MA20_12790 [Bradyrhizobium japonicum]
MAILWSGSQWKVTSSGVDTLDNKYFIEKRRVHEEDPVGYTWEVHMEEKGWVDMTDFRQAMIFARAKWPKK